METTATAGNSRFQVPASEVFTYMLTMPRKSWAVWTFAGLGILLIAAGLIADMRLVAVGLMVWVALVPTAAFFMHYSESLSPKVAPNLLPHTVERLPGGYLVRVYRKQIDEETNDVQLVESQIITVKDSDIIAESKSGIYRRLALKNETLSLLFLPL